MYRKVGEINGFGEIPWNEEIIVTGSIKNGHWMQRMRGVFEQNSNGYRFKNEFGMSTHISPDDFISLNVLKKTQAGEESK